MLKTKGDRTLYYFNEISRIPRESGSEQAISNWIAQWASGMKLEVHQDEHFNLVISKPAAKGYENCGSVILQAHMDMVCEKEPDSTHNFACDPIELTLDGDWITSASGTSLGADNGIGVACAMAILEDRSLKHPMIEAIFTVEEETTFSGAATVSPKLFKSKRMINLDHADDSEVIAGSCGGTGFTFTLPLTWEEKLLEGYEAYKLRICGLKGGHSGEDIHRGRGNAIELLMRVLHDNRIRVASISGGTNRLAIPREAEALIMVKDEASLHERITEMQNILKKEYGIAAPDLDIEIEKTEPSVPMKPKAFEMAACTVGLFPNGVIDMSGAFEGVVVSSNNLGVIGVSEDKLAITAEIRGLYQSKVDDISDRIKMLAQLVGADVEFFGRYSPWEYKKESVMRTAAQKLYRELFGSDMRELVIHAGLECGMFVEKVPDMDIIAIGPNCQSFHSPNERVSISSIKKFYGFLTQLLENLQ